MEAEIEKLQAWLDRLEADVSENLRNRKARHEDLKGAETAETISKVIDALREKSKEASPEIEAKLEAEVGRLDRLQSYSHGAFGQTRHIDIHMHAFLL